LLSDHALSRALARAGLRAPVRFEEVTPSTQALALAMAADGAPEWTLVAAGHQTAGRGRLERTWHDRAGSSLLVSVVLRPSLAPGDAGLLSLLAGAALAETIETVGDQRAVCKWPNDVLIGGRKAAGILAEAVLAPGGDAFEYVVLGIGANLGEAPLEQPDAAAIDGTDESVLEVFLRVFSTRCAPAHPAFGATVLAAYRDRCATLRERVRATTTDGDVVEGVATDLKPDGGLVVERDGGDRVVVRFGDVEHLAMPGSGG
jgi:BirA family transcriptional regulator, biotin operon repressor / biotin---[acetyl-CoA-carboxylase] ligase